MGSFAHEAVAIDINNDCAYLTEDRPDGGLYRFTATNGLPDLSRGTLEIAAASEEKIVEWKAVDDLVQERCLLDGRLHLTSHLQVVK